jgi:hypothetical protein
MDQATADLIARVNTVPVTVQDLLLASAEIHNLPIEDRDWEGRAHCLARMFKGQRDKAFAVGCRLEAMARLIESGKAPHWVLPKGPGGGERMIAEPVFLAAAKEPILFTKKKSFFEPESFIAFVLENSDVDGHA